MSQEKGLFSGKIYTAGANFTRLPVATVVTNLNSGYWQSRCWRLWSEVEILKIMLMMMASMMMSLSRWWWWSEAQPGRRCGCAGGRQGHTALQRPPYLHTTLVGGMMPQLEDTTVSLQYFTSPSSNTPLGNIDTFQWRLPESSAALTWLPWLTV